MALADRSIVPAKKGRKHRIAEILDDLPNDEEREALLGWLNDPAIGSKRIRRELVDEGIQVSAGAITTYRRDVLGVEVIA